MSETPEVITERIDDIPVLLAQMERMQVAQLLDEQIQPHGNWQGLSPGRIVVVWLSFILSEANHRLSHVQPWAEGRLLTLQALVGDSLRSLDFSDDRLAGVLDLLADTAAWASFETALGQYAIRVYDLPTARVRLDSTSTFSYRDVDAGGLFQFGHSKDHRPDLPQLKINLSALDPLGLPLTTTIVSGQTADDPLYVPEIRRVQQVLGRRGVLYIGDAKMASLATRATIGAGGDYYLCPLTALQVSEADLDALLDDLDAGRVTLRHVQRQDDEAPEPECLARGFETRVAVSAPAEEQRTHWHERRLVVQSLGHERRLRKALEERMEATTKAIEALGARGKGKAVLTLEEARARAEQLITKARLEGVVAARIDMRTQERTVRAYGERPERIEQTSRLEVAVEIDAAALARRQRRLGWRVYATNARAECVGLEEAVLAYRSSHRIEHDFARLKGKPLSMQPLYLASETRIRGLVRLLTIGLRVLTLTEFVVRTALDAEDDPLVGVYPGNPKRSTKRPTTELLLRAFKDVTLVVMTQGATRVVYLPKLSAVQQRIVRLLNMPVDFLDRLHHQISDTSQKMSEP